VVNDVLEKVSETARDAIEQKCRMENLRPFTLSKDEYIKSQMEAVTEFALLRHGKEGLPSTNGSNFYLTDVTGQTRSFKATEDTLLTVLASFGLHLSSSKQLVRIHQDKYHSELEVIAHVATYFEIASKRLIDDIPQIFETVFALEFGLELARVLTTNLKLVGDQGLENCSKYTRDEPDIQANRAFLTRQEEILERAFQTLERIPR